MTINRYNITDASGKYLGYIDAPNQGAAEKILRQRSKANGVKPDAGLTITRGEVVASYDMDYSAWDVEQRAGKFD